MQEKYNYFINKHKDNEVIDIPRLNDKNRNVFVAIYFCSDIGNKFYKFKTDNEAYCFLSEFNDIIQSKDRFIELESKSE